MTEPPPTSNQDTLPEHLRERLELASQRSESYLAAGRLRAAAELDRRRRRKYGFQVLAIIIVIGMAAVADLIQGSGWLWLAVPCGILWGIMAWRQAYLHTAVAAERARQSDT